MFNSIKKLRNKKNSCIIGEESMKNIERNSIPSIQEFKLKIKNNSIDIINNILLVANFKYGIVIKNDNNILLSIESNDYLLFERVKNILSNQLLDIKRL